MIAVHLVRYGAMGLVGRFAASDATCYPRRSRVVVRSDRGLEIGEVLRPVEDSPPEVSTPQRSSPPGVILRGVTVADELLQARLEKNRHEALSACIDMLQERHLSATLLDVEPLFDGCSLLFYFLGEVPPAVEQVTAELAEAYDATAQTRQFAEMLSEGCGPGCGTEDGAGQGCMTCTTCAVAGACGTRKS